MDTRTRAMVVGIVLVAAVAWGCGGGVGGTGTSGSVPWQRDLPKALAVAEREGKLVMVDFYTDWCGWCRKLDETTFTDPAVRQALGQLVAVKLDAERGGRDAARRYRVAGYPTLLFLDARGVEVGRIPGYLPPRAFLEELEDIVSPKD